jgi:hypothetical protein
MTTTPKKPTLAVAAALQREARRPELMPALENSSNGKGKKPVIFRLEPDVIRQLKQLALDEGTSVQEICCEALNKVFSERNLPLVAK